MHQAMLAQAVLDKVVERAAVLGVTHVAAVHVLLGEDDEHTEDALRYAWSEVSVGTCAEGAEFVIERTPGEGLRLAAMDVERAVPPPAERPPGDRRCNLKPPAKTVGSE
jgi:Zn finger protein HypA/HybF involved in hydrogenase expression